MTPCMPLQIELIFDLLHPELFKIAKDEDDDRGRIEKLKDKLNTAKEFAQKLTDNEMTLAFLRKGKEALILGKEAKPTVSNLVSRSDDVQLKV